MYVSVLCCFMHLNVGVMSYIDNKVPLPLAFYTSREGWVLVPLLPWDGWFPLQLPETYYINDFLLFSSSFYNFFSDFLNSS